MASVSVKQLILEYLSSKDEGADRFIRLYDIARTSGMRKFNMDIQGKFRTVLLPIGANGVVPFPNDYLDYSMIGIINEDGEGVPLKHNEEIVAVKQSYLASAKGVVSTPTIPDFLNQLNTPGYPLFWLNYEWGDNFMHLYGVGGGRPDLGSFSIDDIARCIRISPGFNYSSILVEYLTDGFDEQTNTYMVDVFAADAFTAWLRWKDNIDKKNVSMRDKEYLRMQFVKEKNIAKMRLNPVKIAEMQDVFRRNIKLVAKG